MKTKYEMMWAVLTVLLVLIFFLLIPDRSHYAVILVASLLFTTHMYIRLYVRRKVSDLKKNFYTYLRKLDLENEKLKTQNIALKKKIKGSIPSLLP